MTLPCCHCHRKQAADGQCSTSDHTLPACVPAAVFLTGVEGFEHLFEESYGHGFPTITGQHSTLMLLQRSKAEMLLDCFTSLMTLYVLLNSISLHKFLSRCSHQLLLCVLPRWTVFFQPQHPRSGHSLCVSPLLPGYPKIQS